MLAILFSALAPTVSHALTAASNTPETLEICTVNGYQLVKISDDKESPTSAKSGMEHCAYCVMSDGAHALTGASSMTLWLLAKQGIAPPQRYTTPHSRPIWPAVNQRAPPCAVSAHHSS